MRAIPLLIDDDIYDQAEQKALALETSVSTVVTDYLREWVRGSDQRAIARETMRQRFANPDWDFAVGDLEDREHRNARR